MNRSLLTFLMLLLPASVNGAELPLQRWAVIATEDVVASGLTDLLTAELSQNKSLQLVERERLEAVMRELQLAALVKPDQVSSRLKLGRILRANALMVLSFEREQNQQRLRIVVCDADLGIRLWKGSFPFTGPKHVESLVQHCVTTIDEVRRRFSSGIQQIVAVPPFLSEDFEHRFDYLQTRCANLLSSSLMAHSGVAVVEIEEARAILRELDSTLSGGLERPIASIVQAKYQVVPSDSDDQHRVTLMIDLSHGDGQRQSIEKKVALNEVRTWLTTDFARQVLSANQRRSPVLSPETQMAILSRHAQRFAELGQWEQSIPLREAALVLQPENALQRALLISEYQHRFLSDLNANWPRAKFAKPIPPEVRERAMRLVAHDYTVGLEHLAWLIRNRLINRVDAIGILGKHVWYKPPYMIGGALPLDPLKHKMLQPACQAQRRFLRDVYPLAMKLPDGRRLPKHLSEPFYGAQYVVTNHVISDVGFNSFSVESLGSLRELLTRHLPSDARTWSSLLGLLNYTYVPKPGDASYPAWIELWTDLSNSDRELARLYGRYVLIFDETRQTQSTVKMEQLLAEVKQLGRTDEPIYNVLNLRLMRPPQPPRRESTAPLPQGFTGPLGRMHLEPILLSLTGDRPSGKKPLIIGMLRCGDVDVYWSKDRFFVMHEPGVLREIKLTNLTADHALFWGVAWDGEFIWLHTYGRGIIAMRPDGSGLTSFKGKTPGYSKGHRIIGLSPGRALMVGSFGQANRAWCGILKTDTSGQAQVDVFFEAKNVPEGRTQAQAASAIDTVFQPDDLSLVRHTDGHEFALVDRRDLSLLLIDLESLEVSIPEKKTGLAGLSTQTKSGYFGKLFLRDGEPVRVRSGVAVSRNSKRILFHDGWLYRPGYVWMRQHVESKKLERLQLKTVPQKYWDLRVGSSAHYGLVTYDPFKETQQLSRVTILNESKTQ